MNAAYAASITHAGGQIVSIDNFAIARATILLLSAPPARKPGQGYTTLWLNSLQVSEEKAIEELALAPKPVTCASDFEHGKLLITCKRASSQSDQNLEVDWATSISDGIVDTVMSRFGGDEALPLLLRSQFDSLILEVKDVRTWFKDYRMSGFSLSLILEDKAAESRGAVGSLVIGKPLTVLRSSFRPPDNSAP
jgi:hypothetical protein